MSMYKLVHCIYYDLSPPVFKVSLATLKPPGHCKNCCHHLLTHTVNMTQILGIFTSMLKQLLSFSSSHLNVVFFCHKIVEGLSSFVGCLQHCTNLSALFLVFGMFVKMHHAHDHVEPIITRFAVC